MSVLADALRLAVFTVAGKRTMPTQEEANKIAKVLLEELANDLHSAGELSLRGFGIFETFLGKPRRWRHPKSGKVSKTPARKRIRFRPSSRLLERLKD